MGNKIYVKEINYRNADGDYLTRVKTYRSEPSGRYYIIWR